MIENFLNYGPDAKGSQLQCGLYFKDKAGVMDEADPYAAGAASNIGLKVRAGYAKNSQTVDMMGLLHSDLMTQPRLLVNGADLRVKLIRSKAAFNLMSSAAAPTFKVIIKKASLFVRKVRVSPSVLLGHAKAMDTAPVKYPITRAEVKTFSIPVGNMTSTKDNLFIGQLPKRVIIGLVSNRAYSGDYKHNPFNFQHFKLAAISLYVDGVTYPAKPFTPVFEGANGGQYVREYNSLFSALDRNFQDFGLDLNRDEYAKGYTLYGFDLTPDLSSAEHVSLIQTGNVRLECTFREALAVTVTAVVYANFDNIISIDKHRNVMLDYM